MKFGEIDVREAQGAFLAHSVKHQGGLFKKAVLPHAILAKSHTPDLAQAMPQWNVESVEAGADLVERRVTRRKVEFESLEFNKRFLASTTR